MDLVHLDEITRQLHFKIEAILTQESSTKVKDYVGRLDREFAPHLPFYLNGFLVKLACIIFVQARDSTNVEVCGYYSNPVFRYWPAELEEVNNFN